MEQGERESGGIGTDFWFIPEIITPAQYYDLQRRNDDPLKRLMLAVLTDAVRCFQTGVTAKNKARREGFREAQHWLFEEDGAGVFSFDAICDCLGIPPHALRMGLRRWQLQQRTSAVMTRRLIRRPLPSRFRIIKPIRLKASRIRLNRG